MIGAVEDVEEPELHELQRRLVPARIELHQPGIAVELEARGRAPPGGRKRSTVSVRMPSRASRGSIEKRDWSE